MLQGFDSMPADGIYSLPFEQQIGQFFSIGLPGTDFDEETRALIEEIKPGGVIIFGRIADRIALGRSGSHAGTAGGIAA